MRPADGEKLPVWPVVRNVSWPARRNSAESVSFLALTRGFEIVASCSQSAALSAALSRHRQLLLPRRLPAVSRATALDGNNATCCLARLAVCAGDASAPLAFETNEAYTLRILEPADGEGDWVAELRAATQVGAYRGLETFAQLVSFDTAYGAYGVTGGVPLEVDDAPYFAHRGLLLDTVRHYLALPVIFRTLDAMALTKMNVFHWHLTDSEALPAESLARPEMWRAAWSPSEVYTSEDIEDVIVYAEARGIRVIPEIDVPGHSQSWSGVFPGLFPKTGCPTKWWAMDPSSNETLPVLRDVLGDFARRFPGELFHLGGDEVGVSVWNDVRWDCWKDISRQWLKSNNFETFDEIFGHFMKQAADIVRAEGKRPVVWDETWRNSPEVPEGAIVQVWEDPKLAAVAVKAGHDVLFSPTGAWYLDDIAVTWENMYVLDPLGEVPRKRRKQLLGGETALWTEMVDASTTDAMIWPRAAAVAERLWQGSPPSALRDQPGRVLKSTTVRLARFRCRLLERGIGASPLQGIGRAGLKGPSSCFGHRENPISAQQQLERQRRRNRGKRIKYRRTLIDLDEL